MSLLAYAFMQRALLAALLSGILAPAIGTYIVQRRLSLLGDGLGHVAIAGVGLAIMTNGVPLVWATIICVAGAVIIELLRQSGKASGDIGLAIMFYGGLAVGVLMAGIAGQGSSTLQQYLFGSLTTVNVDDLKMIIVLAVIVLILAIGLLPQLFAVCADEEFAKTQGLPTRFLNLLIVVMAAITITLSMRTVGLLLVSALMVVPVATSQNLFAGFKATLTGAVVIGVLVSVGGTFLSGVSNTPSGATIVVTAIGLFLLSWPVAALLQHNRAKRTAEKVDSFKLSDNKATLPCENIDLTPENAVLHGDHVDYIHDGQRYAPHEDHFDKH